MARTNHGIEKGLTVFAENGDERFMLLQGTAAPDGVAGDQGNAPLSSLYFRSGTSEIYKKIANGGAPADWEQLGSSGMTIGNWRPERVDAHTGQVLSAGVTDPTGWSDNDGGFDGDDATVGNYVLDGNCDLFEITVVTSSTSITLAAAASAPVADDMFAVRYNLPDPVGQENQAILTYDGSVCIKVADVDFSTATGIVLSGAYAAATGDPAGGDSVELGISKVDGNVDQLTSAVGVAQGDANMGTYTGALLNDNESAKQNIQQLETAQENTTTTITEIDGNVDDLITLSGVPENSTDLGTFTGATIPDSSTNKGALQALETAHEETDQNVDDLVTLSGVAENATDLGIFTGTIIPDNSTNKAAMQSLETESENIRTTTGTAVGDTDMGTYPGNLLNDNETTKQNITQLEDAAEGFPETQTGVSASTVLDSVLVDAARSCVWIVTAFDEANPADIKSFMFHGANNGTSSTDATNVTDDVFTNEKIGGNFNTNVSVVLNGAGAAQEMRLQVNTTEPNVTYTAVRVGCAPSGY